MKERDFSARDFAEGDKVLAQYARMAIAAYDVRQYGQEVELREELTMPFDDALRMHDPNTGEIRSGNFTDDELIQLGRQGLEARKKVRGLEAAKNHLSVTRLAVVGEVNSRKGRFAYVFPAEGYDEVLDVEQITRSRGSRIDKVHRDSVIGKMNMILPTNDVSPRISLDTTPRISLSEIESRVKVVDDRGVLVARMAIAGK